MFLLLTSPTKRPKKRTKLLPIKNILPKNNNESYKFNILKLKLWEKQISIEDLRNSLHNKKW